MSFCFLGTGPCSKSLFLRALIARSYFPDLRIIGDSECDDVYFMQEGLKDLKNKTAINCGYSGAVLRFLALKVSREPGCFVLKGAPRLFQRPVQELRAVLNQLSCEIKFREDSLILKSQGWHLTGDALTVSTSRSSQFASAVLLNSWNLNRDLFVSVEGKKISFSYFKMTLSFLRSLGMKIIGEDREFCVPAGQKINQKVFSLEPDMSCLFALSAMTGAETQGDPVSQTLFTNWPEQSLQPDFIFPSVLEKMGFQVERSPSTLKIRAGKKIEPIKYNLKNCPDLFPVLSALCALADGQSHLYGASQLIYKESNRIEEVAKLLVQTGREVKILEDGLIIKGKPSSLKKQFLFSKKLLCAEEKNQKRFEAEEQKETLMRANGITEELQYACFDPKKDHRMAMAVAVLKKAGLPVHILDSEVVNKSFPNFWTTVGVEP